MGIDEKYVQAVIDRLEEYREKDRDIANQVERLERLEARMYGVGSQNLSSMPKAPSPTNDRVADLIDQKNELEALIREDIQLQSAERKFFEEAMKTNRSSDEKAVIRMRYFDGRSWQEVTEMLYGHKEDFDLKLDTYTRRAFATRKRAVVKIAQVVYTDESLTPAIPSDSAISPIISDTANSSIQ